MNWLTWATGLHGYLSVGACLFLLGAAAMLSRKNVIGVLLGLELMLNGASINFVAFSRFRTASLDGQIFTLFLILIAAAEVSVLLAILIRYYGLKNTVDVDEANLLRD